MTKQTALEKCPKCSRPVSSIYQSSNKKFYNHGEGGTMGWKPDQTFVLTFDDYCTIEIELRDDENAEDKGNA